MIVNYYEPSLTFELPPEEAISYFTAKGLQPTWDWFDMIGEQHDAAFTVAKMMNIDLLSAIKSELEKALASGTTLDTFRATLIPLLQQKGWWGKKDIVGPDGTVITIQLGSASRLETIFRTNLQSAYSAGHWAGIQENAEDMPYLMYDAVDDSKTRPEHLGFDGKVYPIDAKFWQTHFPPNDYNCRCGVIQMDADDVKANGLTISDDPVLPMLKWQNPKTGEVVIHPQGTGPSFAHNSGVSYLENLKAALERKMSELP
ncbi:minor capsid protein [Shewanella avicenniae]|uniref:Minor capsid protein n=1 Tax=Shewanella avicenniae TaxID=2814294 RepID=A0ABX7QM03_9GAMM|nr:phage minor head protein [Shewanella avicenniae]QSX32474.1 minor capsid protein [Shewanella avicenniae]